MRVPDSRLGQYVLAIFLCLIVWGVPAVTGGWLYPIIGYYAGIPGVCLYAIAASWLIGHLVTKVFPP